MSRVTQADGLTVLLVALAFGILCGVIHYATIKAASCIHVPPAITAPAPHPDDYVPTADDVRFAAQVMATAQQMDREDAAIARVHALTVEVQGMIDAGVGDDK